MRFLPKNQKTVDYSENNQKSKKEKKLGIREFRESREFKEVQDNFLHLTIA
jgi:hypothetical protein